MLDRIASLQRLAKASGNGRLARLEQRVDYLTKLIAGLTAGLDIDIQLSAEDRITIGTIGGAGDGAIGGGNYGFLVYIDKVEVDGDEEDHVKVKTGTAQAWGGEVETYYDADLGEAEDGYFVYAVLHLPSYNEDVPYWENHLRYGIMDNQNPEVETWVPIAYIKDVSEDPPEPEEGEEPEEVPPIWQVTQLHWGNIVIPATVNAVDVQENPIPSNQSQSPAT